MNRLTNKWLTEAGFRQGHITKIWGSSSFTPWTIDIQRIPENKGLIITRYTYGIIKEELTIQAKLSALTDTLAKFCPQYTICCITHQLLKDTYKHLYYNKHFDAIDIHNNTMITRLICGKMHIAAMRVGLSYDYTFFFDLRDPKSFDKLLKFVSKAAKLDNDEYIKLYYSQYNLRI